MPDLVTEYCWGTGGGDDPLDRRTRSLLHIVMMVALNRRPSWNRTPGAR
jgi:4-carboxymuconolactone decarboxylase